MDSARKPRPFAAYTTDALRTYVADGTAPPETLDRMKAEIAARESGSSIPFTTPQIAGGTPKTRIGRM